jgi:Tol biopolymer transport system component
MRRWGTVLVLLALGGLAAPALAHAAAVQNGRIFYSAGALLPDPDPEAGSQVWSVNSDGTDPQQLTHVAAPAEAGGPDVSSDGARVLYVSNASGQFQVWVMRANGTGQHRLVRDPQHDAFVPRWSADGQHLLFTRCSMPFGFIECTIAAADADGTNLRDLTSPHWADFSASYAPNGRSVAFSGDRFGVSQAIYRSPVAGGRPQRLTPAVQEAFWPDYRPDGRQIVFGNNFDRPHTDVWTMRPDGSHAQQISHIPAGQDLAFARYAPDGAHLVADLFDGRTDWLVTLNADGSGLTKIVRTNNLTLADWAATS